MWWPGTYAASIVAWHVHLSHQSHGSAFWSCFLLVPGLYNVQFLKAPSWRRMSLAFLLLPFAGHFWDGRKRRNYHFHKNSVTFKINQILHSAQECMQICTIGVRTSFCVFKYVIAVVYVRTCSQNFHLVWVPCPAFALPQVIQRSHSLSGVTTDPMLVSPRWGWSCPEQHGRHQSTAVSVQAAEGRSGLNTMSSLGQGVASYSSLMCWIKFLFCALLQRLPYLMHLQCRDLPLQSLILHHQS